VLFGEPAVLELLPPRLARFLSMSEPRWSPDFDLELPEWGVSQSGLGDFPSDLGEAEGVLFGVLLKEALGEGTGNVVDLKKEALGESLGDESLGEGTGNVVDLKTEALGEGLGDEFGDGFGEMFAALRRRCAGVLSKEALGEGLGDGLGDGLGEAFKEFRRDCPARI
jgi:hypothetical protein